MTERIEVEVVYALRDRQCVLPLVLESGATVADALREAAASDGFSDVDLTNMPVGVWGVRVQDRTRPLQTGDRIEVYRPLLVDPVTARRRAAASATASAAASVRSSNPR